MRTGVDRVTGAILQGWDECRQSIGVIATTAIGALVLQRDFGSNAPGLQDRPQTPPSIMDHFVAIAEALRKWEPGYRLTSIKVTRLGPDGVAGFALAGTFFPNGHLGDFGTVISGAKVDVGIPGFDAIVSPA